MIFDITINGDIEFYSNPLQITLSRRDRNMPLLFEQHYLYKREDHSDWISRIRI